jgi:site-specific recombinase XerD
MSIEEITKGIANTHFRTWYKRKVWDSATDNDLKIGIKKFFEFLAKEKGIENNKVLPKKT